MNSKPVTTIQSATLIVVRESNKKLEVLMTERNPKMNFAGGALVFPGGKVDPEDDFSNYKLNCTLDDDLKKSKIAAIRELFEETGLLITQTVNQEKINPETQKKLIEQYRNLVKPTPKTFPALLRKEDLILNLKDLSFVGNWITPEISPKRFDTKFFITEAPIGQELNHDNNEALTAEWLTPEEILMGEEKGKFGLMFPTKLNILKLQRLSTLKNVLNPENWFPVVKVTPQMEVKNGEKVLTIPEKAGYDFFEVPESQIFEFAGLNKAGKQKK